MEKYPKKIYCSICLRETNHYIISSKKISYTDWLTGKESEDELDNVFKWDETYNIGQCCGCDKINYFTEYFSEDFLIDEDPEITAYPSMPFYFKNHIKINPFEKPYSFRVFTYLPYKIQSVLSEIKTSLSSEKPQALLITMGIRMILEALTLDLNIKKGWLFEEYEYKDEDEKTHKDFRAKLNENGSKSQRKELHYKLFKMYENKIITLSQFNILLKIKNHGNTATHEISAPTYSTIMKMFSVVEDILHQQYELKRIEL